MNRDSLLFPWIAACVAVGICLAQYVVVPFWGATFLILLLAVALLCAFALMRRDWVVAVALSGFFVLIGWLRAQMGDVSLLPHGLTAWGESVSGRLLDFLRHAGMNAETTSLLEAMLLGVRENLPDAVRQLYRSAGASHVLALSGLHLGILFGLLNFWLQHALLSHWRYWVGTLGIILMWGYVLLTGFPMSLCRASVMMTLMVVARMRLEGDDNWHSLGMAAFLILLFAPSSVFDIGFQLSFAAVAGILLFFTPLREIWQPPRGILRNLWNLNLVGVGAQLGVLPLLLYWFHSFSLLTFLIGPFVVLLASFILYVALLMLLLRLLGMGSLLCRLLEVLVALQHGQMALALRIPWSRVEDVHFSLGSLLLLYMAILCLLPPLRALQQPVHRPPLHRLAMFFRTWPYLLTILILLTALHLL